MNNPERIGPYTIIREIGRGGMGEVYLANDPIIEREVALKRVKGDLKSREVIRQRFIREAKITGQLAHPSIVPIYDLHEEDGEIYYIMPYVEGRTLKEILVEGTSSIVTLLPIFFSICQAIAFAHSRGFIHRDIKPENVLVGKYGQVQILDWGLVKAAAEPEVESDLPPIKGDQVTQPGKIVGTLAYMAPERVLGHPSTMLSDIYALGVILYQILALKLPFKRSSIKEFKRAIKEERFVDPSRKAPYRDVPPELSRIARKCLFKQPKLRYQSVDELIRDLQAYFEGRSQWFAKASLEIDNKKHWLFQEHLVIPEHNLIIRGLESAEWVLMMVSKQMFGGNIRLATSVRFEESCHGLGLLLGIPGQGQGKDLVEGYCLWLAPGGLVTLLKSNVTLAETSDHEMQVGVDYLIVLEKIDDKITVYIDDKLILSYTSHLPITTGHVGVLFKDRHFTLHPVTVFVGSLNLSVSCLSIPDAFLACRHFSTALAEYRRIGAAFSGRAEGREALFRAGMTLLQEGSFLHDKGLKEQKLEQARLEFEKLQTTAAKPLEYLGKSLVYQLTGAYEEEVKCLQLAFRRYKDHPLLEPLKEQLLLRLHESSRKDRRAAFRFMLVLLQEMPDYANQGQTARLIKRLERYNEQLPFMTASPDNLGLQLAFWLCNKNALIELAATKPALQNDSIACLIRLGETPPDSYSYTFEDKLFMFDQALDKELLDFALPEAFDENDRLSLDARLIWKELLLGHFDDAFKRLHSYPMSMLSHEVNILHYLLGCCLVALEGEDIAAAHFCGIFDTPLPRTWQVATHYLYSKDFDRTGWLQGAFYWEKKQLYRQLILFYHCAGQEDDVTKYKALLATLNYE